MTYGLLDVKAGSPNLEHCPYFVFCVQQNIAGGVTWSDTTHGIVEVEEMTIVKYFSGELEAFDEKGGIYLVIRAVWISQNRPINGINLQPCVQGAFSTMGKLLA